MKKTLIVLFLTLLVIGCGNSLWDIEKRRENLNKLEVGMTKTQVIEIMGKPYMTEATKETEWLLYWTVPYGRTDEERYTPIAFRESKVIGWGRNFWTTKEQRYDVKIDQKIKQE